MLISISRTITGTLSDFGGALSIQHKTGTPRPFVEWTLEDMMSSGYSLEGQGLVMIINVPRY